MRSFVILCILAMAFAAPQYNYQRPIGGSSPASVFGGTGQFSAVLGPSAVGASFVPANMVNIGFASGGAASNFAAGGLDAGGSNFIASSEHLSPSLSTGGSTFNTQQISSPPATIISKHFHTFAAPDEEEDVGVQKTINVGPSRKHYRVVFIKAPHQSNSAAALQIAQAQNEEKTVIYVLSKKTDLADIQTHIQEAKQTPSKPEVFFIKYKTPEEAAHAQKQIQSQYDSLGGTSQVIDEGIAPITSVVGALGTVSGSGSNVGSIGGQPSSNAYLPPN